MANYYITGDKHGNFDSVEYFCQKYKTTTDDVLIILGDVGLNYFGGRRDDWLKRMVSAMPVTLFCIHGNHEARPTKKMGYKLTERFGGPVMVQDEYPNIAFAQDGNLYELDGQKTLVLGGAYSIDKQWRLDNGRQWFPDEQPNDEIIARAESSLHVCDRKVDVVLSHTCPRYYEPVEFFLPGYDQSKVDKKTENWLQNIEERLDYKRWYCGHHHIEKNDGKVQFMYKNFEPFMEGVD